MRGGASSVKVQLEQGLTVEEPRLHVEIQTIPREEIGPRKLLSQAIQDRYRYPEGSLQFSLDGPLSARPGYFRFSGNTTCFGRSSRGVGQQATDASQFEVHCVPTNNGDLSLPFDPTEVVDNLRLERYAYGDGNSLSLQTALKTLYYTVRPLTTHSMRRCIQRFRARNWTRVSFPKWPVDTTVEDICGKLLLSAMEAKHVNKLPFVWFWPNGARGCLTMTHDVETEAGRSFCSELMNIDDAYGVKASFQIVPEGRYHVSQAFLASFRKRGFEIAVQDLNHDGRLFDDRQEFLRRAKKINQYKEKFGAKGFRAAVLYRKPEWYGDFNFAYDMSIPNVAHLDPQSGGCCTVFPYFIGDMVELPVTTVQDYMLFHILNEHSISLWQSQIETILGHNGLVSFIVHPDYVIETGPRKIYESLLAHIHELRAKTNLWCALPLDIESWWRARSQMSVVKHGNRWQIEGEHSHRATLAFAKNANGKLVYELESAAAAV